jgi:DNA processing protein
MNSELTRDFRSVRCEDSDYPARLRELPDRPPVLYVKGRWPLPAHDLMIAVVGARRASPYGLEAADYLTSGLVRRGVVAISGLAAGVDACAHRATLQERGWTVAVLGHGFAYQFPKENAPLFEEITQKGTLVTEFPYDTPPLSHNFPQRNRIISGLSRGVVVVDAGEHSGALITARCAAEQGRDVFVVPGSIFSPQTRGCHRLIKEGARLVESAEDIFEEYGMEAVIRQTSGGSIMMDPPLTTAGDDIRGLTAPEQELMNHLSPVPLSIDELTELSGLSVDRLAEVLLALELKGRIQSVPGQRYVKRH